MEESSESPVLLTIPYRGIKLDGYEEIRIENGKKECPINE